MLKLTSTLLALSALTLTSPLAAQSPETSNTAPQEEAVEEAEIAPEPHETTQIVLETSLGAITIALETERAPITAGNFLRYVKEDRFNGAVFYRAMRLEWGDQPNGLIQGGAQNHHDRILPPITHEPTSETGVLHERGSLSMAMGAPGTANGDFSILLRDMPQMDADPENEDPNRHHGYAAFAKVISGMEVVEAIHAAQIDPELGGGWMKGEMLADPVVIIDARVAE